MISQMGAEASETAESNDQPKWAAKGYFN